MTHSLPATACRTRKTELRRNQDRGNVASVAGVAVVVLPVTVADLVTVSVDRDIPGLHQSLPLSMRTMMA